MERGKPLAAGVTVIPRAANAGFEAGRGADVTEKQPRQNSVAVTRSQSRVGQHRVRERLRGGSPGAAEPALSCAVTARKKEAAPGT